MILRPTLRFLTRPRPPGDLAARFLAAVILPPRLPFAMLKSPPLYTFAMSGPEPFSACFQILAIGATVSTHIYSGSQRPLFHSTAVAPPTSEMPSRSRISFGPAELRSNPYLHLPAVRMSSAPGAPGAPRLCSSKP